MQTMAAIKLSHEAHSIYSQARAYVYETDTRHYDGRMPDDVAGDIYRHCVGSLIQRSMLSELEPYQKQMLHLCSVRLSTDFEPPKELKEVMDYIVERWRKVQDELLNESSV